METISNAPWEMITYRGSKPPIWYYRPSNVEKLENLADMEDVIDTEATTISQEMDDPLKLFVEYGS